MIKKLRRALSVGIILLVCLSILSIPAYAPVAATCYTPRTVRIAYPIQSRLTDKDAQGLYSGYTYDYLQEIAQYSGWDYEIVEVPGEINAALNTSLKMLEQGEVDLLGGLLKNEQTESQFDFPEYGYGYSYTTLLLLEDNPSIHEANFQEYPNLKIAAFRKAARAQEMLAAYCQINNISYDLVLCDSEEEINQALQEGRADLCIGNSLTPVKGMRSIAQYGGVPFYFAVAKDNVTLLRELNQSILTIKQTKPFFELELSNRYFLDQPQQLFFTEEEQQYLNTAKPLRVALPQLMPIQSSREDEVSWGISPDILHRIGEKTGLTFTYLPVSSYREALELLDTEQADLISGIPYNYGLAREHGLLMSDTFLSTQWAMVIRRGQVENKVDQHIAVVDRQATEQYLADMATVSYDTALQCMEAVKKGEVDGALLNLYSVSYLGYFPQYRQLQSLPQAGSTADFCFGVKKERHSQLIPILNKTVRSISEAEMDMLVQQNMDRYEDGVTLKDFVEANPITSLGIVTTAFILLLIAGGWVFHSNVRARARLEIENQRYRHLYELANEYIYEYDCQTDTLSLSKSFAHRFSLPEQLPQFHRIKAQEESSSVMKLLKKLRDESTGNETCYRLPNGEERWYRNTFVQIKDEHGQVRYFIGKLTDVQEEIKEREKLERQAQTDGLTQLYNAVSIKRIIDERLSHLQGQAALLMLDIDLFKEVNDSLGHHTGDIALSNLAELLQELAGENDVLGRLGGDEFVVYLDVPQSQEQVKQFCRTLCRRARRVYSNDAGIIRPVSVSIGAVLVRSGCTFEQLYQAADKLLYESKAAGRDRYTISRMETDKKSSLENQPRRQRGAFRTGANT